VHFEVRFDVGQEPLSAVEVLRVRVEVKKELLGALLLREEETRDKI